MSAAVREWPCGCCEHGRWTGPTGTWWRPSLRRRCASPNCTRAQEAAAERAAELAAPVLPPDPVLDEVPVPTPLARPQRPPVPEVVMQSSVTPISLANVADGQANDAFVEAVQKAVQDLRREDLAPKPKATITVSLCFELIGDHAIVATHAGTRYSAPKRKTVGRLVHLDDAGVYVDQDETDPAGNRQLPFPNQAARS